MNPSIFTINSVLRIAETRVSTLEIFQRHGTGKESGEDYSIRDTLPFQAKISFDMLKADSFASLGMNPGSGFSICPFNHHVLLLLDCARRATRTIGDLDGYFVETSII